MGVRFIKRDRVIHLQVKQGKLMAGGAIDNETMSWVSLPQINVNNWRDRPKFHKLNYESRGLDLDDLVAPEKYLVTGIWLVPYSIFKRNCMDRSISTGKYFNFFVDRGSI